MAEKDLKKLTKKERKEYAKELREKEESSGKLKSNLIKLAIFIVAAIVVGGFIYVFTLEPSERPEIGQSFPEQGREHITQGSTEHPPYSTNPPTSGPHWATPAECKTYTEEVPDEAVIHSLEHGAIWVTYKDKNNTELVQQLTSLVEENSDKVLLSPRSANDDPIAVASWGRLLVLEKVDEDQILSFISNYRNNAPEPLAQC